jgi:hypothetical protein
MNARNRPAIEAAANDLAKERIELDDDQVTQALASQLVGTVHNGFDMSDAIETGIDEAIDEFDEDDYDTVVGVIRDRVTAEVEAQAKEIAMRLLRECAEVAKREAEIEVQ